MKQPLNEIFLILLAMQADPEEGEVLYEMAETYSKTGNYRAAEICLRHLVKRCPDDHLLKTDLGHCLDNQSKHKDAEIFYREVIGKTPDSYSAHFHLGVCLMHQRRLLEAINSFEESLRCKPLCFDAIRAIALTYREQGDFPSALDYAKLFENRARENNPGLLEQAENLMKRVLKPLPPTTEFAMAM